MKLGTQIYVENSKDYTQADLAIVILPGYSLEPVDLGDTRDYEYDYKFQPDPDQCIIVRLLDPQGLQYKETGEFRLNPEVQIQDVIGKIVPSEIKKHIRDTENPLTYEVLEYLQEIRRRLLGKMWGGNESVSYSDVIGKDPKKLNLFIIRNIVKRNGVPTEFYKPFSLLTIEELESIVSNAVPHEDLKYVIQEIRERDQIIFNLQTEIKAIKNDISTEDLEGYLSLSDYDRESDLFFEGTLYYPPKAMREIIGLHPSTIRNKVNKGVFTAVYSNGSYFSLSLGMIREYISKYPDEIIFGHSTKKELLDNIKNEEELREIAKKYNLIGA